MKRKRPLTEPEWQALAADLRQAVELLDQVDARLHETLTLPKLKPFHKAFAAVQALRSQLDDLVCSQYRQEPWAIRVFYGNGWTYYADWEQR